MKFFKSLEKSEKHRGGRDLDSLVAFIDEQMGRAPAKKEVSPLTQCNLIDCSNIRISFSSIRYNFKSLSNYQVQFHHEIVL